MASGIELASAYVSIIPSARGFGGKLSSEIGGPLNAASAKAGKDSSRTLSSTFHKGLKSLAGSIAGIFAVQKIAGFFKDSVNAASDLNETVNKSNIIFGANAGEMLKWASGAAKNFGLSKQSALDAASGFGDMFSQLGVGATTAAEMSRGIVQMSADFGSFNNLPTAEVTEAIAASFRGEFDSLQRVIPNINAARVEQEALNETHKASASDLTAAEKAQATYNILQKDGTRAAGDFARTSSGLANSQKIAAARFEDLKVKIGQGLLPVMAAASGFLANSFIPQLSETFDQAKKSERLREAFRSIGKVLVAALAAIGPFAQALGNVALIVGPALAKVLTTIFGALAANRAVLQDMAVAFSVIVVAVKLYSAAIAAAGFATKVWTGLVIAAGVATKTWAAIQAILNAVLAVNPVFLIIGAVAALVVGIILAYRHSTTFRNIVTGAFAAVAVAAVAFAGFFTRTIPAAFQTVIGFLRTWGPLALTVLLPFLGLPLLVAQHWGRITGYLSAAWQSAVSFLASIPSRAVAAVGNTGATLAGQGRALIGGLAAAAAARAAQLVRWLLGLHILAARSVLMTATTLAAKGRALIGGLAAAAASRFAQFVGFLHGIGGSSAAAVGSLSGRLAPAGRNLIAGLANAAISGFGRVTGFLGGIGGRAAGAVGSLSGVLSSAGRSLIDGLIDGIEDGLGRLQSTLNKVTGLIPDWKGPADRDRVLLRESGQLIIGGLIGGLESRYQAVRRSLGGLTDTLGAAQFGGAVGVAGLPFTAAPAPAAATLVGPQAGVRGTQVTAEEMSRTLVSALTAAGFGDTTIQVDSRVLGRVVREEQARNVRRN